MAESATVAEGSRGFRPVQAGQYDGRAWWDSEPEHMVGLVILWRAINEGFGNWLPVAVAVVFGVGILRARRFEVGWLRPSTGVYLPRVVDQDS